MPDWEPFLSLWVPLPLFALLSLLGRLSQAPLDGEGLGQSLSPAAFLGCFFECEALEAMVTSRGLLYKETQSLEQLRKQSQHVPRAPGAGIETATGDTQHQYPSFNPSSSIFKRRTMPSLPMTPLVVVAILAGFVDLAVSSCPAVCQCPLEAARCAPGVGLVLDSCGCCKVCAKQLNDDCSKSQPCDHTKGLECNFGASSRATKGICRAKSEGRPCEYNSRIYQNGESFQPNCKHQCTCIDGAVGCLPLCPQELSLPNLGCPNPRLVKVPGQCCEEWVCDKDKDAQDDLEDFLSKDFGMDNEGDLTSKNEFVPIVKGGHKMLPVFGTHPHAHVFETQKCIVQTTSWSQCSKTCGTGISTRVTNDNKDCRLVRETRICEVRPCGQTNYSQLKKGKKCTKTKKSPAPVRYGYAGCSSVKKYRPKYCGSCLDGRCCTPQQTRTVKIRFRCEDGETFTKNVMMIQSCRCNYNCPHTSEAYPYYRLFNDIHKFRD